MKATVDRLVVVAGARVLERAAPVVPAVEVVTDRFRVERRPIVELHAVPKPERPDLSATRQTPFGGQLRNDRRRSRLERDETFVDLFGDTEGLSVRDERRIQIRRIRRARKDERATRLD